VGGQKNGGRRERGRKGERHSGGWKMEGQEREEGSNNRKERKRETHVVDRLDLPPLVNVKLVDATASSHTGVGDVTEERRKEEDKGRRSESEETGRKPEVRRGERRVRERT
jgi:hypothetical protein